MCLIFLWRQGGKCTCKSTSPQLPCESYLSGLLSLLISLCIDSFLLCLLGGGFTLLLSLYKYVTPAETNSKKTAINVEWSLVTLGMWMKKLTIATTSLISSLESCLSFKVLGKWYLKMERHVTHLTSAGSDTLSAAGLVHTPQKGREINLREYNNAPYYSQGHSWMMDAVSFCIHLLDTALLLQLLL